MMAAQIEANRRPLTLAEAAVRVGVHPRTIRRWVAAGRLTGYRYGPRLVRVDAAELDAFARAIPAAGAK